MESQTGVEPRAVRIAYDYCMEFRPRILQSSSAGYIICEQKTGRIRVLGVKTAIDYLHKGGVQFAAYRGIAPYFCLLDKGGSYRTVMKSGTDFEDIDVKLDFGYLFKCDNLVYAPALARTKIAKVAPYKRGAFFLGADGRLWAAVALFECCQKYGGEEAIRDMVGGDNFCCIVASDGTLKIWKNKHLNRRLQEVQAKVRFPKSVVADGHTLKILSQQNVLWFNLRESRSRLLVDGDKFIGLSLCKIPSGAGKLHSLGWQTSSYNTCITAQNGALWFAECRYSEGMRWMAAEGGDVLPNTQRYFEVYSLTTGTKIAFPQQVCGFFGGGADAIWVVDMDGMHWHVSVREQKKAPFFALFPEFIVDERTRQAATGMRVPRELKRLSCAMCPMGWRVKQAFAFSDGCAFVVCRSGIVREVLRESSRNITADFGIAAPRDIASIRQEYIAAIGRDGQLKIISKLTQHTSDCAQIAARRFCEVNRGVFIAICGNPNNKQDLLLVQISALGTGGGGIELQSVICAKKIRGIASVFSEFGEYFVIEDNRSRRFGLTYCFGNEDVAWDCSICQGSVFEIPDPSLAFDSRLCFGRELQFDTNNMQAHMAQMPSARKCTQKDI